MESSNKSARTPAVNRRTKCDVPNVGTSSPVTKEIYFSPDDLKKIGLFENVEHALKRVKTSSKGVKATTRPKKKAITAEKDVINRQVKRKQGIREQVNSEKDIEQNETIGNKIAPRRRSTRKSAGDRMVEILQNIKNNSKTDIRKSVDGDSGISTEINNEFNQNLEKGITKNENTIDRVQGKEEKKLENSELLPMPNQPVTPRKRGRPRKSLPVLADIVKTDLAKQNQDSNVSTNDLECKKEKLLKKPKAKRRKRNKIVPDSSEVHSKSRDQGVDTSISSSVSCKTEHDQTTDNEVSITETKFINSVDWANSSIESSGRVSLEISFDLNETGEKKKQGRPKGARIKEKRLPDTAIHYPVPGNPSAKGVKCVGCGAIVIKALWPPHNQKVHNNIAWRDGDKPVNLSDREEVFSLWNIIVKKKIPLKCAKCGVKKLSAVGYYSHITVCGKRQEEIDQSKVKCPFCSIRMLAASIKPHIAIVHKTPKQPKDLSAITEIITEKRAAASRALQKFKEIERCGDIKDLFRPISRPEKPPAYYQSVWKKRLQKGAILRCFSLNCSYSVGKLDEIIEHYETCPAASTTLYACKDCNFHTEKKDKMLRHLQVMHKEVAVEKKRKEKVDINWPGNDYGTSSSEDERKVKTVSGSDRRRVSNLHKSFGFLKQCRFAQNPSANIYKWTVDFRESNYADSLFGDQNVVKTAWKPIATSIAPDYLPKVDTSIPISHVHIGSELIDHINYPHQWKTYETFEGTFTDDEMTMFCGGRVYSMAWAPNPLREENQYLAVSTTLDMSTYHKISQRYIKPGLIQLWDLGPLANESKINTEPRFSFGIGHNEGIIWHLEWCPSGCYELSKRIGLLATACSSGNVYIYAVPFPEVIGLSSYNNPKDKIFQTKPVYKLNLMDSKSKLLGERDYQATTLKWSKLSGHNIVVVGFSNGMVALWNLNTTSPFLYEKEDSVIHLTPYLSFQAHLNWVTAICLSPFDEGRWLFTASYDRCTKFWDLTNVKFCVTDTKKGLLTTAVWLPRWNCIAGGYDEVDLQTNTVTRILALRNYGFKSTPFLRSRSTVKSVDANDFGSTLAQVSTAGELQISMLPQMFKSNDKERVAVQSTYLSAFADSIDRTRKPEDIVEMRKAAKLRSEQFRETSHDTNLEILIEAQNEHKNFEIFPETYEEAMINHGLIFGDFNLISTSQLPVEAKRIGYSSDILRECPPEMYPINSMNVVTWNPNIGSYEYLALGYQAGFVRIHKPHFAFLKHS